MSPLGLVHTTIGVAALLLGTVVVLRRKGTRRHRWLGRGFALAMLLLNGTALMIYRLLGHFGPFHGAALISLFTLVAGLWPALSRRPGWAIRHAYFMSWSYCGLLAATAAEIASRVPGWDFFWSVLLSSGIVIVLGALLIERFVPRAFELHEGAS